MLRRKFKIFSITHAINRTHFSPKFKIKNCQTVEVILKSFSPQTRQWLPSFELTNGNSRTKRNFPSEKFVSLTHCRRSITEDSSLVFLSIRQFIRLPTAHRPPIKRLPNCSYNNCGILSENWICFNKSC